MTKEEIREEMARKLILITKRMSPLKAATFTAYKVQAEEIIKYLHSQGVVIKVERELPDIRFSLGAIRVYDRNGKPISHADAASYTQQDMLKAGYEAVEPLV